MKYFIVKFVKKISILSVENEVAGKVKTVGISTLSFFTCCLRMWPLSETYRIQGIFPL